MDLFQSISREFTWNWGNYPIFRVVLFPFDFESLTYELEEHGIFILPMITLGVSWSMVIFRGVLWWSLRIVNDSPPNLDWFTSARSRAWRTMFDAFNWVWVTAWDPGLNIQIPGFLDHPMPNSEGRGLYWPVIFWEFQSFTTGLNSPRIIDAFLGNPMEESSRIMAKLRFFKGGLGDVGAMWSLLVGPHL